MPAEKPMIFTAESVRAILDGRKTQTRRVMPQPVFDSDSGFVFSADNKHLFKNDITHAPWQEGFIDEVCKYGVGDIIWVREPWAPVIRINSTTFKKVGSQYTYMADLKTVIKGHDKFKSPRFMPKAAARLFLEITDIKIEQLQQINQEGAKAEGVFKSYHRPEGHGCPPHTDGSITRDCYHCSYKVQWDQINGPRGFQWDSNPWVWVYTFKIKKSL